MIGEYAGLFKCVWHIASRKPQNTGLVIVARNEAREERNDEKNETRLARNEARGTIQEKRREKRDVSREERDKSGNLILSGAVNVSKHRFSAVNKCQVYD